MQAHIQLEAVVVQALLEQLGLDQHLVLAAAVFYINNLVNGEVQVAILVAVAVAQPVQVIVHQLVLAVLEAVVAEVLQILWEQRGLQILVVEAVALAKFQTQVVLVDQVLLLYVIGMINYTLFVTPEEYRDRYTICKTCEQFNSALALCKECSCFMPMKCKLSEAECPTQKWTTSSNRLTTEIADL
jgi:hypothetical protein